ncbi:Gfo/Idh/MocA family oxidoreductase [Piscinibacter sp.]|jgi:predicted dehydrogenase|uniref:Gfo/Idh/MocA family protein n=1 Tax=Piscinibacter sp. TaxID=1903157 RepID=UPI001D791567|nr:Gfo/Idh/MocA family oxidoreductase [Piscinibacter sp.]MBK7531607.1 Gfo/Idh/MocA family oxidoreductase [Piscinibacter sp.]HOY35058.1 Gfo/Idh/MocA family oxidoreductase [Piscinibacter sp.]HPG77756.1 Gfo/Idh/MocA family oxidoreductase [Piscinibacter sp.]
MKKVVWGVLSTARIGIDQVLPSMQASPLIELRGIASRSLAAARAAAQALGIPRAYGSYEELLADPEIEAIYNPLPNNLHVPLTLKAAAAGKHVLCEKPIALSAEEARALLAASRTVCIEEAFMVRHHPQWQRARELVRAGRIGTPRAVQVFFSYFNDDPANIRNRADIGGGALYDIGCYAILAGRYLFEAEPRRVVALVDRDPAMATDRTTSALLDFGDGRQAGFTVSTQSCPFQRVQVVGTTGRIELRIPFNAPRGGAMAIAIDEGGALDGSSIQVETLPAADQYQLEAEAFSLLLRGEAAASWGLEDALAQLRVIDALWRSEQSARWEAVG